MNTRDTGTPHDTKEKILNAAEALFAAKGFRGTTMRAITEGAGVNLAAVNYHFGSKQSLLEDVIRRRIIPLNEIRRQRLEEVRDNARTKGRKPHVRAVLLAFIEPTMLFRDSGQGARNFFTFIGRSFTDPDNTVRRVFMKYIKPIFELLFEIILEALPGYPRELLFWRLHFSIGSLLHAIQVCSNIDPELMGIKVKTDTRSLIDQLLPFITAGMKAK